LEVATKFKDFVKTIINVIKAYNELKRVRKELEQFKQDYNVICARNLELAEEAGKLKGELSAKTKEIERLSQEMTWKDDEILRLSQKITQLKTNFEEKVRIEAERRLYQHVPALVEKIKAEFISTYLSNTWTITCNKCHCKFSARLTSQQIAGLIKDGYTFVECLNKNCIDEFLFGVIRYPHKISLRLEDFVESTMKEKFAEIYKGISQSH
jgi:hypothetical protein